MLFDRYTLLNFLTVFTAVSFVSVILVSTYALLDFLLGFKEKNFKIALEYFFNLLPLGFYYLSFIILSIAIILFLKRIFEKKIDLTLQSFMISPLRFSAPLLTFSLFLSFIFILGNQFLFPKLIGNLWYIEKTFKKKQRIGGVIKNFWFLKEGKNFKSYYYIENLNLSDGTLFNLYSIKVNKSSLNPVEILKVFTGKWEDDNLFAINGEFYNFLEGKRKFLYNKRIDLGLTLKDVQLFAEKIDFLSLKDLLELSAKSRKFGLNAEIYLGELIFRILFSLLPFFISLFTLYLYFRFRELKKVVLPFIFAVISLWGIVLFPKILTQKANQPANLSLIPIILLVFLTLKGIHNLSKGFRI
ncbi:MAG: hypothetical protein DSY42_00880 [Aquifex sp.]|nr:MAG: hypothetical protein DSY42_00880 [Aquifex sp.]